QYYAEYSKGGALYKLWLEDENSINLKSSLAQKYRLAGTAAWRMNFETPLVWEVLYNNLKVYKTYEAWQEANPGGQAVPKYY
ncbi:MAG: glycoside hydrolase, partial [Eubacteriales bacterium]|nr:glycoside hydrolase [Eubacteriales bacterium]